MFTVGEVVTCVRGSEAFGLIKGATYTIMDSVSYGLGDMWVRVDNGCNSVIWHESGRFVPYIQFYLPVVIEVDI